MLRIITHKLVSKRGASLSMALMLLLVCTTVAGVALTAATVVAGRQARTKAIDKSYYNVTSAAKLYWDEMKNDKGSIVVSIERTCTIGADGTASWDCKIGDTNVTTDSINNTNASLFELASYDYLFNYEAETLDFTTHRKLTNASKGITPASADAPPKMEEINPENVKDCTYEPFDVTPTGALSNHFKPVHVTVKRKLTNTYEFVFSDKSGSNDTSYECTLTAALLYDPGDFTTEKNDAGNVTGYKATAKVSWTPLSMEAGRSQQ